MPLHPRLSELTELLVEQRAALLAAVDTVPAEARERRAVPDGWSVAEVLDHLARSEVGTARFLAKRIASARESGVGADPQVESVRHRLDQYQVAVSTGRFVAPERIAPGPGVATADALAALRASREVLLATIHDADGVDLTQVRVPHPAFGEFDGYQWLLFVGQHEARHARQILAIRDALAGGGTGGAGGAGDSAPA